MKIGGIQWTSMLDYPGRISIALFTSGCDFRCPFCHNPELVTPGISGMGKKISEGWLLGELAARVGFHDAVVVSGGEPTLQSDLPAFLSKVRRMGFATKLDTNGHHPEIVAGLIERGLVDYVAMDVKAPRPRYSELANAPVHVDRIERTMQLLVERAPDYEFRTTVAPTLSADDLVSIGHWIRGAKRYFLQAFHTLPGKPLLDPDWQHMAALPVETLEAAWTQLRAIGFDQGGVRS